MSRSLALIVVLICLPALGQGPAKPLLTQEQQNKLKERDRIQQEAERLEAGGKLTEAVSALEKVLALEREVYGDLHTDVAGSLEKLAELQEIRDDLGPAHKACAERLALLTKALGEQHWRVRDARLGLEHLNRLARMEPADRRRLEEARQGNGQAVQLHRQGKTPEAIALVQKALEIRKQLLGEDDRAYLASLYNLGWFYRDQQDYARAEPLLQQVLAGQKKLLGDRHPDYGITLNTLGWLFESRSEYTQAESYFRQALAVYQVVGEDHPDYATTVNNLAMLYESAGDYRKAEPLYRQALQLRRRVLGERHPDYATSLNALAELYRFQGKYAEAEPLYQEALQLRRQVLGDRHPDYAISLNNLALLYRLQARNAEAEPLYRQALEITKQVLGERHPHYAVSLNNLALLYESQGKYAEAEPLLQQALAIQQQALGERHPFFAYYLNNLADLYQSQGKYAEAEPLFRKSLELRKQVLGERHPDYALALDNLAWLYVSQKRYAEAEPLCRQALQIRQQTLGERHPDYATTLNKLGLHYEFQGKYAEAEALYQKALLIRQQVLGERHPDYAASLNNLAWLYHTQGKYGDAERLFRQALEVRQQVLGQRHPDYAESLNALAWLYQSQGKYDEAEALYRQAFVGLRQRPDQPSLPVEQLTANDLRPLPVTMTCLGNYCIVLQKHLGPRPNLVQLRSADHAFAVALAMRERLRQEVLQQDASRLHHGSESVILIPRRLGLCQRLFEQEGQAADLETAFTTAEQGTARLFLERLGRARAQSVGGVHPELRQQEAALRQEWRDLDARLAKEQDRPFDRRSPEAIGKLLGAEKEVEARLDQLVQRLEREYPQYAALKYPKPCSLNDARACLGSNEVAVLFALGDEQSYAVLVEARPSPQDKAHGLAIFPLPGMAALADGVSSLTDPDILALPERARALGLQAYGLLLGPLGDRLQGKDLVIVPDGALCQVPFELLVEQGQYLVERHRVRYAPSLTALHLVRLWEKTRVRPTPSLFAVGDPIYDLQDERLKPGAVIASASQTARREVSQRQDRGEANGFPRLKHSGGEVTAIAGLLHAPDAMILLGTQALEAKVKEASASGALARARYVHFATHGILGLDVGQQPAMVLSLVGNEEQRDADGGINDGFLWLDEVTRLQLNADLVVLSACRTGQGWLYSGEGVTGLARAFLYAGSRGVVSSLWAVDDAETANLMTALYGRLQQGASAADALREAKLRMIHAGTPPRYWASFILMGE